MSGTNVLLWVRDYAGVGALVLTILKIWLDYRADYERVHLRISGSVDSTECTVTLTVRIYNFGRHPVALGRVHLLSGLRSEPLRVGEEYFAEFDRSKLDVGEVVQVNLETPDVFLARFVRVGVGRGVIVKRTPIRRSALAGWRQAVRKHLRRGDPAWIEQRCLLCVRCSIETLVVDLDQALLAGGLMRFRAELASPREIGDGELYVRRLFECEYESVTLLPTVLQKLPDCPVEWTDDVEKGRTRYRARLLR
jgi:hypothetical protein